MKHYLQVVVTVMIVLSMMSCRSTRKFQTAITKKDTVVSVIPQVTAGDSLELEANADLKSLAEKKIDFNTFSAKAKVEYEDRNGKQPDVNAFIRLKKDSVLWISISATFLNIEALRVLITPDSITILNKLEKTVEYKPFGYIESIAHIPLTFSILQDLLIGNPIFVSDSIVSYRKTENLILIGTIGKYFKNLLTISSDNKLLQRSKLDDADPQQNRTADFIYSDYQNNNLFNFATYREITVAEKSKVDIRLSFKQFEFNKELSFSFKVPGSYKIK
ncbi:MAG: DUF4292 domain-containing protein [Ginsengibacter sp.]